MASEGLLCGSCFDIVVSPLQTQVALSGLGPSYLSPADWSRDGLDQLWLPLAASGNVVYDCFPYRTQHGVHGESNNHSPP